MKTNAIFTQHPNQESKSGKAPYAAFTKRNFSDNESLPGRSLRTWDITRGKGSSVVSIYTLIKKLCTKLFGS